MMHCKTWHSPGMANVQMGLQHWCWVCEAPDSAVLEMAGMAVTALAGGT